MRPWILSLSYDHILVIILSNGLCYRKNYVKSSKALENPNILFAATAVAIYPAFVVFSTVVVSSEFIQLTVLMFKQNIYLNKDQ